MGTCKWCGQYTGESERTCGWCGGWLVELDRTAVPGVAVTLLTLAQRWGIPDDAYRDDAIRAAAPEEQDAIIAGDR